ncbi:hypothetical protein HHI36_004352 [Cryptolaemus montrouzieri]|uniref:Uncharacterized protein n=1 Tax=Cryptolaemus montrouzieri TaxID=559131 RepID=A0ABD2NR42_9CUCU
MDTEGLTFTEMYNNIIDSLKKATQEAIGIQETKRNQAKHLQEYKAAKNEVRRLIKTEMNNIWDQHCQQKEILIGEKRCKYGNSKEVQEARIRTKFTYLSSKPSNGKIIKPAYFRKKEQSIETNPQERI